MGLRKAREERMAAAKAEVARYSLEACAKAAGVSVPTYLKMEADPRGTVTDEQKERLAEHFGCTVRSLFMR